VISELILAAHKVALRDRDVRLTPKEFDLLVYLARHPRRVITHRTLLSAIWGGQSTEQVEYLRVICWSVTQEAGTGSIVAALHHYRALGWLPLRAWRVKRFPKAVSS